MLLTFSIINFVVQITSKEQYESIIDEEKIIILNYGEHSIVSEEVEVTPHNALFWTFTTKKFMRFLENAIRQQSLTENSINVVST